jgi:hypothetical protein
MHYWPTITRSHHSKSSLETGEPNHFDGSGCTIASSFLRTESGNIPNHRSRHYGSVPIHLRHGAAPGRDPRRVQHGRTSKFGFVPARPRETANLLGDRRLQHPCGGIAGAQAPVAFSGRVQCEAAITFSMAFSYQPAAESTSARTE